MKKAILLTLILAFVSLLPTLFHRGNTSERPEGARPTPATSVVKAASLPSLPVGVAPNPVVPTETTLAETGLEKAILDKAMTCPKGTHTPDRQFLLGLLQLEERHGVPPTLRGMVLAAACVESGYDPDAEGDHKFSRRHKPKAIGILQQWPWWEHAPYYVNRRDPMAAADAWLVHVAKQVPSVQKRCIGRDTEGVWLNAWVQAVRAPKVGGRCGQIVSHYHLLQQWRKSWEQLFKVT